MTLDVSHRRRGERILVSFEWSKIAPVSYPKLAPFTAQMSYWLEKSCTNRKAEPGDTYSVALSTTSLPWTPARCPTLPSFTTLNTAPFRTNNPMGASTIVPGASAMLSPGPSRTIAPTGGDPALARRSGHCPHTPPTTIITTTNTPIKRPTTTCMCGLCACKHTTSKFFFADQD